MNALYLYRALSPASNGEVDCYFIGDENIPSLLDRNVIIAELSREMQGSNVSRTEFDLAYENGAHILWFIDPTTGCNLIEAEFSLSCQELRPNAPGKRYILLAPRLKSLFDSISSFQVVIRSNSNWRPLAHLSSDRLWIAAYRANQSGGVEMILPMPAEPISPGAVARLVGSFSPPIPVGQKNANAVAVRNPSAACSGDVEGLTGGRARSLAYEIFDELVSLKNVAAVLITVALVASSARYFQQYENYRTVRAQAGSELRDIEFYQTKHIELFRHLWRKSSQSLAIGRDSDDLHDMVRAMYAFGDLGEYENETHMLRKIVRSGAPSVGVNYLKNVVSEDIYNAVQHHDFEQARFHAQRIINVVNQLPQLNASGRLNGLLSYAHAVVDYDRAGYPYAFSTDAKLILDAAAARDVSGVPFDETDVPISNKLPQAVLDNFLYSNIANDAGNLSAKRGIDLWRQFLRANPGSERRAEAKFNIINGYLKELYPTSNDRRKVMSINKKVLLECVQFVNEYPQSYLADDALRDLILSGATLGRRAEVVRGMRTMFGIRYRKTDSAMRMVRKFARQMGGSRSVGRFLEPSLYNALEEAALTRNPTKLSSLLKNATVPPGGYRLRYVDFSGVLGSVTEGPKSNVTVDDLLYALAKADSRH